MTEETRTWGKDDFAALWERLSGDVRRLAANMLRGPDYLAVDEICLEVAFRCYRLLERTAFVGDEESLRRFLFGICRNCLRDYWRTKSRNRHRAGQLAVDVAERDGGWEGAIRDQESQEQLQRAIDQLDPELQQPIRLALQGKTLQEITDTVNADPTVQRKVHLTTVHRRIKRAEALLREALAPDETD